MNFKKTWKRFRRHFGRDGGFTLVELIVVIAILAILAGVAVPAYNGYIEKANESHDVQLLADINTAFAAACMNNGEDPYQLEGTPVADLDKATKKFSGVTYTNDKGIEDSFDMFYDMGETEFKVKDSMSWIKSKGAFDFDLTVTYNGITLTLSQAAVQALIESTFLGADSLGGSAGLLDKVDFVTQIAAGMASGSLSAVFNDPAFMQCAMNALGVKTQKEYTEKQDKLIAELQKKNPGMTRDEAVAQLSANAAVLYASQSAVKFTDAQIGELFSSTGIETIKDNLKGANTTEGMAQAALVYGMYTAYANSKEYGNATLQGTTEDPLAVLNALEKDTNFKAYINSPQGQTDLDAYLGALGMINDSAASDPSAVEHLMVNGFNNSELKDILANATGK